MPQRFLVDRGVRVAYLALSLAACKSAPGVVVPSGATPVSREQVAQWVGATVPREHRLHRFKWLFRDERSSAGGRGSARVAPPDSLRFDDARFDRLAGGSELRRATVAGSVGEAVWGSWNGRLARFQRLRAKYLLY